MPTTRIKKNITKVQKSTTKAEIVKYISKNLNVSLRIAAKKVEVLFNTIGDAILDGNDVDLSPFGLFTVKKQGSRISRNPHTGERIAVKGKSTPCFVPGKEFTRA